MTFYQLVYLLTCIFCSSRPDVRTSVSAQLMHRNGFLPYGTPNIYISSKDVELRRHNEMNVINKWQKDENRKKEEWNGGTRWNLELSKSNAGWLLRSSYYRWFGLGSLDECFCLVLLFFKYYYFDFVSFGVGAGLHNQARCTKTNLIKTK